MKQCISEDFSQYKHFVSLGGNCYVAEDLAYLGLRDCSYPFDWCFSEDFSGIIYAIEDHFDELLSENVLFQHKSHRGRYYNQKYKFSLYHDFNKYLPLRKQIADVEMKYNRRVERFFKDISEPTVFFRYVICKNDYNYIVNESNNIEQLIKSFCPENRIIYLVHHNILENNNVEYYLIDKDLEDWICRTPLQKNTELKNRLLDFNFPNREKNIEFNINSKKQKHTKFSIEKSLRRIFKKEYIYSKVCER